MSLITKILSILVFTISINAIDKIYFLPTQAQEAKDDIIKLFQTSTASIDIAMYNFKHKKLIKELKKAKKRGVKINLYLDAKKAKKSKFNSNEYKTFDEKLHIKATLFDKKTLVFGSANWKKESFNGNIEVIYITDNKYLIDEFNNIFKKLNNYN